VTWEGKLRLLYRPRNCCCQAGVFVLDSQGEFKRLTRGGTGSNLPLWIP
jgi:hypothetical protein